MAHPQRAPAAEAGNVSWVGRLLKPFGQARAWVRRLPGGRTAWRVGVAVVGAIIVLLGIVLLPLPGPGWVIVFAGIGLWATEFAWAERLLRWTKRQVREYSARIKAWWLRRKHANL